MSIHDAFFGELRSLTQLSPHPGRFVRMLELCELVPGALAAERFVPYLDAELRAWPDHMRRAPASWGDVVALGQALPPTWGLIRALELRELEVKTLRAALKSTPLDHLTHLTLTRCRLGPKAGAVALGKAFVGGALTHLVLDDCELGTRALELLLESEMVGSLRSLDLRLKTQGDYYKNVGFHDISAYRVFRDGPVLAGLTAFSFTSLGPSNTTFLRGKPDEHDRFFSRLPALTHLGVVNDNWNLKSHALVSAMGELGLISLDLSFSTIKTVRHFEDWPSDVRLQRFGFTPANPGYYDTRGIDAEDFSELFALPAFSELTSLRVANAKLKRTYGDDVATLEYHSVSNPKKTLEQLHAAGVFERITELEVVITDGCEHLTRLVEPGFAPRLERLRFGALFPRDVTPPNYGEEPPPRHVGFADALEALLLAGRQTSLRHVEWSPVGGTGPRVMELLGERAESMRATPGFDPLPELTAILDRAAPRQRDDAFVLQAGSRTEVIEPAELDAVAVRALADDPSLREVKALKFEGERVTLDPELADAWDAFWMSPHLEHVQTVEPGQATYTLTSRSLEAILEGRALPNVQSVVGLDEPSKPKRGPASSSLMFPELECGGDTALSPLTLTLIARVASGLFDLDDAHPFALLCDWDRVLTLEHSGYYGNTTTLHAMKAWMAARLVEDPAWGEVTTLRVNDWFDCYDADSCRAAKIFFGAIAQENALTTLEVHLRVNDYSAKHVLWPNLYALSSLERLYVNSGYSDHMSSDGIEFMLERSLSTLSEFHYGGYIEGHYGVLRDSSLTANVHAMSARLSFRTLGADENLPFASLRRLKLIEPSLYEESLPGFLESSLYQGLEHLEFTATWTPNDRLFMSIAAAPRATPLESLTLTRITLEPATIAAFATSPALSEAAQRPWKKRAARAKKKKK